MVRVARPYTCRLRTTLQFVVEPGGPTSKPSLSLSAEVKGLRGNPAAAKIDAVLRPGAVVVRTWNWENWCGKAGKFIFLARAMTTANFAWSSPLVGAPSCVSRRSPSTLSGKAGAAS